VGLLMGRIHGSLLICRSGSHASFVRGNDVEESLPWHRLETRHATEAFLRRFKPACRATTSDKYIYDIDCDADEIKSWFDEVAYSTAELLRTAATVAEQSGDLGQAERLYMRLVSVLETKIGRESMEVADVMLSLAELSYKAGRVDEGTRYYEKMQQILKHRSNSGH
jgi:hypothetical protein